MPIDRIGGWQLHEPGELERRDRENWERIRRVLEEGGDLNQAVQGAVPPVVEGPVQAAAPHAGVRAPRPRIRPLNIQAAPVPQEWHNNPVNFDDEPDPEEMIDPDAFLGEPDDELEEKPMRKGVEYLEFLKRPRKLPPYCPKYDGLEEVRFRLQASVILYEQKPMLVREVAGKLGSMTLYGDIEMKSAYVPYRPDVDLRSPEPGYITLGGNVNYLMRLANRTSKQGMTSDNSFVETLHGHKDVISTSQIKGALDGRKDMEWSTQYFEFFQNGVLSQLRLSNHIAVGRHNAKYPTVFYKNRKLGYVSGHKVILNALDSQASWIQESLEKVKLAGVRK